MDHVGPPSGRESLPETGLSRFAVALCDPLGYRPEAYGRRDPFDR